MSKPLIKYVPLSKKGKKLAKAYCELLGYECIIDDVRRVSIIIDPNKNVGLLQEKDGVLHYFHKGHYEPILQEDIENIKYVSRYIPPTFIRKIFGILNFEKRNFYTSCKKV